MSAPHTPGPWSLVTRPDGTMVVLVRDANGNPRKHIADMSWAADEDGTSDARLIVAAPCLLAALEGMLRHYTSLVNCGDCGNWDPETESEVIAARAALARAKVPA